MANRTRIRHNRLMSKGRNKGNEVISSDYGITIIKCPICGKGFIHNASSIYRINKNIDNRVLMVYYDCYTCWRKAGGDNGNAEVRPYNKAIRNLNSKGKVSRSKSYSNA